MMEDNYKAFRLGNFIKACSLIDIDNALTNPEGVIKKIKQKALEILEEIEEA